MIARLLFTTGPDTYAALFGNPAAALLRLESWVGSSNSELSTQKVTLAMADQLPVGLFVALPGAEVPDRRRKDIVGLIKACKPPERAALKSFLSAFSAASAPVAEREFYLRALAVDAAYRGFGIGRTLMEKFLAEGEAKGFSRFRVDVAADNGAALALYRSFGFRTTHTALAPPFGKMLCSMALNKLI